MIKTKTITSIIIVAVIASLIPGIVFASSISKAGILGLVNQERASRGLNSLTLNLKLEQAAQAKAEDMITRDYWDHFFEGKSPWDWMGENGYYYIDAGENLAIDFEELEPMHKAWMNSPTHRTNIISPSYKEIGIGISRGHFEDHETIIVVQMFGNPEVKKEENVSPGQAGVMTEKGNTSSESLVVEADEVKADKEINDEDGKETNIFVRILNFIKNLIKKIDNFMSCQIKQRYARFYSFLFPNLFASTNE